jgi:hypothetical protein
MIFKTALKYAATGNAIKRKAWNDGRYIFIGVDGTVRDNNFDGFGPASLKDSRANDWTIHGVYKSDYNH